MDAEERFTTKDTKRHDGNVSETSRPYFLTGNPKWTTYSYDSLGRVIEVVFPDNTENKYTYDALTTTVTLDVNNLDETTTTVRNPEGQVASVTDSNKGVTSYAYDAFGNALTVTSPDQTQIKNQFDTLGRKITSTDPDMGTWLYNYDNLGELLTQQSPLETSSNLTSLGYDVLGRLTLRTEPDMTASWCYDGSSNTSCPTSDAVGSLVQASCTGAACAGTNVDQGAYTRSYAYDFLSRPLSVTIQYGTASAYTSSEYYDNAGTGLVSNATGFSGFQTANIYNAQGYLSSVTNNGGTSTYWTANTVDASGDLTEETAGNGIVTQRSYDANTGRLTAIAAGNDGDTDNIADLSYTWDDIGNLTSRTDNIQNYAENFCYDTLNRLTNYALFDGGGSTACSGGTINKSIGYDAEFPNGIGDGNITGKSDIGIYTYGQTGAGGPHAVTSINTTANTNGGCTLSSCKYDGISNPNLFYDGDGNIHCVTTRSQCDGYAARTYGFTSFDMAATISSGASTTSIGYSPEHQRGSLTTGAGTLYYFNNPAAGVMEELAPGGTWRTYLVPYGHIVAEMFTANGTTTPDYFVGDHLASTTALTDQNGNQAEYDSYDAWGARRKANGNDNATGCNNNPTPPSKTTRGFTSQEEMDSLCLVNLNARLYDPAIGRMLSADSIVPNPQSGQSYNRYSYVENNPLSATDPSGHDACGGGVACYKIVSIDGGTGTGNGDTYDGETSYGEAECGVAGCSGPGIDYDIPIAEVTFNDGNGNIWACYTQQCLGDAQAFYGSLASKVGYLLPQLQQAIAVSDTGAVSDDPALLIGGFNDQCCAGSLAGYAVGFAEKNPGMLVTYLSWDQALMGAGQSWLDALPDNVDVTLIGQSLGAWIAAGLAVLNPGTVNNLITILSRHSNPLHRISPASRIASTIG